MIEPKTHPEKPSISSLEATDREKALIDDLSPWPLSNEEAWAVARKHIRDLELGYQIYKRAAEIAEKKLGRISDIPVAEVGRIVEAAQGIQLIFPDGTGKHVSAAGWDHFG